MATYEKSFKEEAVRLSDDIGVKQAAAQLGIPYWTLADWRAARKARGSQAFVGSGHKRLPTDEKERRILELEKENSELKRANEILKDALGFFAESRRKWRRGCGTPTSSSMPCSGTSTRNAMRWA